MGGEKERHAIDTRAVSGRPRFDPEVVTAP